MDSTGTPTDPTTPDTEVSQDNGTFADAAEEVTTATGSNGMGMITLTGAETNNSTVGVAFKVASGPKATLMTLTPAVLATVGSGTLSAGSAGGGTLGTLLAYDVTGCFIQTTGGTGGGGTSGANNQARKIVTYTPSTGAFTVAPNWEVTPSTDTTYSVLLPEGVTLGMLRALNPATPGRTLVVDAAGLGDATAVKLGPSGSATVQTARDLGASVLLAANQHVIVDSGTVTTLTNLPAIPASWLTAAGIASAALNGKGDWLLSSSYTTPPTTAQIAAAVMGDVTDTVGADVVAIKAKTDNLPASPAAVGSAMTLANGSITTVSIADGAITDTKFTVPSLSAPATGILGFITQLWRRFFRKTTLTATQLKTFADNETTVVTTQVVSDDTVTQTQGTAT